MSFSDWQNLFHMGLKTQTAEHFAKPPGTPKGYTCPYSIHTHTQRYTHTHTHIQIHTHIYTYTHTHARTHIYTHTRTYIHTHTHTHTYQTGMYTHTSQTHTHTHKFCLLSISVTTPLWTSLYHTLEMHTYAHTNLGQGTYTHVYTPRFVVILTKCFFVMCYSLIRN